MTNKEYIMKEKKRPSIIDTGKRFIIKDVWRIQTKHQPRLRSFFLKQLRMILVAFRGFKEDGLQLRASALTFFTLLSIVPVAAMAFGVAKGFGFEKLLEQQIMEQLAGQQDVVVQVLEFAKSLLENTKGGLVAGIGVAMLFWTVIKVLGNIELSFNAIWGVKYPRSLGRKFADYLSIMLICPILMIVSSSATVFITTQITNITARIELLGYLSPAIFLLLKLLPFVIYWLLFTFVYIFMPNTKVKFTSALIAGVIAGSIYQVVQWVYIDFQIGVSRYNAIYGSFAALPLFLMWVQISWLIVLFGAEISFAHQNVDTYEFEPDCLMASRRFKRIVSLRILNIVVKNLAAKEDPLTDVEISQILETPIRLVRQLLYDMLKADLMTEVYNESNYRKAYHPAWDIHELTIKKALDAIEHQGIEDIPVAETEELKALKRSFESFDAAVENSSGNMLLKDV